MIVCSRPLLAASFFLGGGGLSVTNGNYRNRPRRVLLFDPKGFVHAPCVSTRREREDNRTFVGVRRSPMRDSGQREQATRIYNTDGVKVRRCWPLSSVGLLRMESDVRCKTLTGKPLWLLENEEHFCLWACRTKDWASPTNRDLWAAAA